MSAARYTVVVEWDASDSGTKLNAQRWVVTQYSAPYRGEGFVVGQIVLGPDGTTGDAMDTASRLAAWLNWREGVE